MFKKITFLLCTLFSINTILAITAPLTQYETNIYNALKKEYPNIDNVLTTNNITAQKLCHILRRKIGLLDDLKYSLQQSSLSLTKSKIETYIEPLFEKPGVFTPSAGGLLLGFGILFPFLFSIPPLALSLAVHQFMAPSHAKTVITSGLIGAGGILSTPAILLTLTAITGKLKTGLNSIIYYQQVKQLNKLETEVDNEINDIDDVIQTVKNRYPNVM